MSQNRATISRRESHTDRQSSGCFERFQLLGRRLHRQIDGFSGRNRHRNIWGYRGPDPGHFHPRDVRGEGQREWSHHGDRLGARHLYVGRVRAETGRAVTSTVRRGLRQFHLAVPLSKHHSIRRVRISCSLRRRACYRVLFRILRISSPVVRGKKF